MDQIFKLILIYMLFRASFLFFLRFYFYSIFAECRGGETGNSSSKNRGLRRAMARLLDTTFSLCALHAILILLYNSYISDFKEEE